MIWILIKVQLAHSCKKQKEKKEEESVHRDNKRT